MAAKDYKICCGLINAYIAKPSKREQGVMTNDRREIAESEILMLIDWFANKDITENNNALRFYSGIREGKVIEVRYIDAENAE